MKLWDTAHILLLFSGMIFFIGLFGLMIRKNLLVMLMCLELMLNAVNLSMVVFSRMHHNTLGQVNVLFIITVAAAEAAVGLSLIIGLFRIAHSVHTRQLEMLKG